MRADKISKKILSTLADIVMPLSPEYRVLREPVKLQTDPELFLDLLTNYHNILAQWLIKNRNSGGLVRKEFGQFPFLSEIFGDKGEEITLTRNIPFDLLLKLLDSSQLFFDIGIGSRSPNVENLFVLGDIGVKAINIYSIWEWNRQNFNENNYTPFSSGTVRISVKDGNADGYVYICIIQSLIPIPDLKIICNKQLLGKTVKNYQCSEDELKRGMVVGLSLVFQLIRQLGF